MARRWSRYQSRISRVFSWLPTLFRREFHWELSRIGLVLGTTMIIASTVGLIAGGKLSEAWAKQGRSDANLRIMLYGLFFSVPLATLYPLRQLPLFAEHHQTRQPGWFVVTTTNREIFPTTHQ